MYPFLDLYSSRIRSTGNSEEVDDEIAEEEGDVENEVGSIEDRIGWEPLENPEDKGVTIVEEILEEDKEVEEETIEGEDENKEEDDENENEEEDRETEEDGSVSGSIKARRNISTGIG